MDPKAEPLRVGSKSRRREEEGALPSTGLDGPWPLSESQIDSHAMHGSGAYVLGHLRDPGDLFVVEYAGRSDDDLNSGLRNWLNTKYRHFKCCHFGTVDATFDKECRIYHAFSPPDNAAHPARSQGSARTCPVADCRNLGRPPGGGAIRPPR